MSIAGLIIGAVADAAGEAIKAKQGDTIKNLKRSRAVWRERAIDWENKLYEAMYQLDQCNTKLKEMSAMRQTALDERDKARRERDELHKKLIAKTVGAADLNDVDDVYPDADESALVDKEQENHEA